MIICEREEQEPSQQQWERKRARMEKDLACKRAVSGDGVNVGILKRTHNKNITWSHHDTQTWQSLGEEIQEAEVGLRLSLLHKRDFLKFFPDFMSI